MSRLVREPLEIEPLIAAVASPQAGALLTFAGVVRDNHRGRKVNAIDYHAYERMAVEQMDRIEAAGRERWPGIRLAIAHRIGLLEVGEVSAAIAVSSAHRAEGFEALRFAIESLKKDVPIWKKEIYPDGYEWIRGS